MDYDTLSRPMLPLSTPYDLVGLTNRLRAIGLDIAEDAAKAVMDEVLVWIMDSASLSENKVDDFLHAIIPIAKPHIDELIESIDGEIDPFKV